MSQFWCEECAKWVDYKHPHSKRNDNQTDQLLKSILEVLEDIRRLLGTPPRGESRKTRPTVVEYK
jgi:hypothetical protein